MHKLLEQAGSDVAQHSSTSQPESKSASSPYTSSHEPINPPPTPTPPENNGHWVGRGPAPSGRQQLVSLQRVILMASLAISMISAALPIYAGEYGASGIEKGIMFSLGALMAAIARPLVGRAIDRQGRKRYLLLGIGIVAVAMGLFALSRPLFGMPPGFAIFMLTVSRTVHGFGVGTLLLAAYTMTADLAKSAGRGTSFGYTEQSQFRGGLYGFLIAIPILALTGYTPNGVLRFTQEAWTLMFITYAISTIIALFLANRWVYDTRALAMNEYGTRTDIDHQRIDPYLYALMAIVALTSASAYGLTPFILSFLQEHVVNDTVLIGMAYLPAAIIWGVLPSRMGRFSDRFGRKPMMIIGLTASAVSSILIPFVSTLFTGHITLLGLNVPFALLVLMLFLTIEATCYAAAVPAEQAMVADMTGGQRRGIGFGLYTLGRAIGEVIGPVAMGGFYDVNPAGAFIVNAVILVIGSFLVWFVLRDPQNARKMKA